MRIRDIRIAIPLFFEALAGSIIMFCYCKLWNMTYRLFPRRHNIHHFIWVTTRPSLSRFRSDLESRRKKK